MSDEPTATYVDIAPGDVVSSLVLHTPRGTVHAVRPAAPIYIVAIPDSVLADPAVPLARRLIGGTDEHGRWVVPAELAGPLLAAIEAALDGRPTDLTALTLSAIDINQTGDTVGTTEGA